MLNIRQNINILLVLTMSLSIHDTIVVNGDTKRSGVTYNASKLCSLFKISNWRSVVSSLTVGMEKIIEPQMKGEDSILLTTLGAKKIIGSLSEDSQLAIDTKVLQHFGLRATGLTKKISEKAEQDKPLEKNPLIGYLKMVYPDQKVFTHHPFSMADQTVDIYIPGSDNKKVCIAIICDAHRTEPLQLTAEEKAIEFSIKATTSKDVRWILYTDYQGKRPRPSFFKLIFTINDTLYGPLEKQIVSAATNGNGKAIKTNKNGKVNAAHMNGTKVKKDKSDSKSKNSGDSKSKSKSKGKTKVKK